MKKNFGGINLTWPKLIVMAIVVGIYTGLMAMLPIVRDTSFIDLTVTFEVWIFFGIFIIMNSKSAKDCLINAGFKKAGKTQMILESPDGKKTIFDISIRRDTYELKEKSN